MGDNPDNLIFYDYNKGGVITTNQVCSMYKKICKDAGIPYYGQHALRHTFATRCIEAGIQPVVLKEWLGHTNIHVTLDTYADVFDRMNLGAISKFEDYMDKVLQGEEQTITELNIKQSKNRQGDLACLSKQTKFCFVYLVCFWFI